MTSDPLGLVDGPNTYAYVRNNPVNGIDPDGQLAWFGIPIWAWFDGVATAGAIHVANTSPKSGSSTFPGMQQNSSNDKPLHPFASDISTPMNLPPNDDDPENCPPPLKRIHSADTLKSGSNRYAYEYWKGQDTQRIINSLRPGSQHPLRVRAERVRADGRIFDGNTRIYILESRGINVNSLPRTLY